MATPCNGEAPETVDLKLIQPEFCPQAKPERLPSPSFPTPPPTGLNFIHPIFSPHAKPVIPLSSIETLHSAHLKFIALPSTRTLANFLPSPPASIVPVTFALAGLTKNKPAKTAALKKNM